MESDRRIFVQVADKYNADLPEPQHGNHLWTWIVLFKCADPTGSDGTVMLDRENLISINGPGCFHCEEIYSPAIAQRRCKPK